MSAHQIRAYQLGVGQSNDKLFLPAAWQNENAGGWWHGAKQLRALVACVHFLEAVFGGTIHPHWWLVAMPNKKIRLWFREAFIKALVARLWHRNLKMRALVADGAGTTYSARH
eukprot:g38494.t1